MKNDVNGKTCKAKRRKAWKFAALGAALVIVAITALNLPKPVKASDEAFDLTQKADGVYPGACDNGLVKVQVEVTVRDHSIAEIRIVSHQNGMGGAAEAVAQEAVRRQSVEVDAVSGATMSSKTILKAVENALM